MNGATCTHVVETHMKRAAIVTHLLLFFSCAFFTPRTCTWGGLFTAPGATTRFKSFFTGFASSSPKETSHCLVIAGDVFDNATPSHFAQNLYYDFLTAVRGKTNCRHIVITSGNHDSPSFLNAPQRLLSAFGVTVVGEALSDPAGEALLLRDASGEPEAVVAAVPFLREADIRKSIEHETDEQKDRQVIEGTRRHYRDAVDGALALRKNCGRDDIPLIATGHLFAAHCDCGTEERSLYIGSLGQIPAGRLPRGDRLSRVGAPAPRAVPCGKRRAALRGLALGA